MYCKTVHYPHTRVATVLRMLTVTSSQSWSIYFNVRPSHAPANGQVRSMLTGLTGFVHIVVKGLLQMSCMLCMSVHLVHVLFYIRLNSERKQYAALFAPETDSMSCFLGQKDSCNS